MPFSGLDSPKGTPLGWIASFSGPESRKPSLQTTHTTSFQDSSHENHTSLGPRSKLFRTRVIKTHPQVRQHAIFRTRLPKRPPIRVDGLFFGTRVTKTIPPIHPHHLFSRPESWKSYIPRSKSKLFRTRVMKTLPQVRQHAIFRTRLPKRRWVASFPGLGSRKPSLQITRQVRQWILGSFWGSAPKKKITLFRNLAEKTENWFVGFWLSRQTSMPRISASPHTCFGVPLQWTLPKQKEAHFYGLKHTSSAMNFGVCFRCRAQKKDFLII